MQAPATESTDFTVCLHFDLRPYNEAAATTTTTKTTSTTAARHTFEAGVVCFSFDPRKRHHKTLAQLHAPVPGRHSDKISHIDTVIFHIDTVISHIDIVIVSTCFMSILSSPISILSSQGHVPYEYCHLVILRTR